MFPATSYADLHQQYDFSSKENFCKWKDVFIPSLETLSSKHAHSTKANDEALRYVEKLVLQMLGMICSRPSSLHSIQDVQEQMQKFLPSSLDITSLNDPTSTMKLWKKRPDNIIFPSSRVHSILSKQYKVDQSVTVYICSVLQDIVIDIFSLVGNYVRNSGHNEFSMQDVKTAISCDTALCNLFKIEYTLPEPETEDPSMNSTLTYTEVVQDILQNERHYLRDLQMLTKIFKEALAGKLTEESQDLEEVFKSIEDIAELTMNLISTIEDTVEMTEPNQTPSVGICFHELAENLEFDAYLTYEEAFNSECQLSLESLLNRKDFEIVVSTAGHGFLEAVKFYFPKLLSEPFYHCGQYKEYIKLLKSLSPNGSDKSYFTQVESMLARFETPQIADRVLNRVVGKDLCARMSGKGSRKLAQKKVSELKKCIENFDEIYSNSPSNFTEFLMEGDLLKISSVKKTSDRYAYLFDGYLVLCKVNYHKRSAVVPTITCPYDYRLKECFSVSKMEVRDREDIDDLKYCFEIVSKEASWIFSAPSYDKKANWMAVLVMLTNKSMLDRILDRYLSEEEKTHPLQLPPVEKYRFAEEDSDENIVLDKDNGNTLIKGATLLKLVERLTHHLYSDPHFIITFLTTYRSFCTPHEMLDLLIERFNIPDPEIPEEERETFHGREMLKRFRKEYVRHVHLRVLNAIKQWVLHHFYDFERDETLQAKLWDFLKSHESNTGRGSECLTRIFKSVQKLFEKAIENSKLEVDDISYTEQRSPPPIEYHIKCPVSQWNIITIHPIEFARQLILLESEYYRAVKSSELVGQAWTKENKYEVSPNLLKMIHHTTNVTRWFEKTIMETDNFDERVAVISRIIEIMIVLLEWNNFNGVFAVVSAIRSAAVYRLSNSLAAVPKNLMKALEEAAELQKDHNKKYQEKLRSINPPCIPFFGTYLTNIIHIEEGNPNFLPGSKSLINFSKRRRVAEITSEIRHYQYSRYCFQIEPELRAFIEKLQPFPPDEKELAIGDWLYQRSLEIKPRDGFESKNNPRRWPELSLKSPGIKRGRSHPVPRLPPQDFSRNSDSKGDNISTYSRSAGSPIAATPSSNHSGSPQSIHQGDFSIFAPVIIGEASHCGNASSGHNFHRRHNSIHSISSGKLSSNSVSDFSSVSPTSQYINPPPPLPPKPRKEVSEHCLSSFASSPQQKYECCESPPPLPPRKASPRTPNTPKPPIPIRRNSSNTNSPSSLSAGFPSSPFRSTSSSSALSPSNISPGNYGQRDVLSPEPFNITNNSSRNQLDFLLMEQISSQNQDLSSTNFSSSNNKYLTGGCLTDVEESPLPSTAPKLPPKSSRCVLNSGSSSQPM